MSQPAKPAQPEGNFVAFENSRKGDGLPAFVGGRISVPGEHEEFGFSLWANRYEKTNKQTGEITRHISFGGTADGVARGASAIDRINAMGQTDPATEIAYNGLTLRDGQIAIFENGFKADAPEKDRPDFWGAFYPGKGKPVVRISLWARTNNDRVVLTGRTSYPIPGKSEAEMQDLEQAPTLDTLLDSGQVAKGEEATRKSRSKKAEAER